MRREIIFSDLGVQCTPFESISKESSRDKWQAVTYETGTVNGTMLSAVYGCHPQPVVLKPNLTGWYNIYIATSVQMPGKTNFKLTNDDYPTANMATRSYDGDTINECYWKSADMTGQDITISKNIHDNSASMVAWLRFEPMTDEQVEIYNNQFTNKASKRLNSTNDGNVFSGANMDEYKIKWAIYRESDFESMSFEIPVCGKPNFENYKELISYGHEVGLKMFMSMRMGLWGTQFPGGPIDFTRDNPQWHCVDRDNEVLNAMSYAYEGVQDHVINNFLQYVPLGCDAVEFLFNRGVPYILFEQPFVDAFQKKYPGINPKLLALDNPKIIDIKCELMTGFVRRLRCALDKMCAELGRGRVDINVRGNYSIYDNKLIGIDIERWAQEGLIARVISTPTRVREVFEEDVWADSDREIIDMEKYTAYLHSGGEIIQRSGGIEHEATPDSKGIPAGPATLKERIEEFTRFSKRYNIPVYYDIWPNHVSPHDYQSRFCEMYEWGAEYFSFWDAAERTDIKYEWNMLKRLGHREELAGYKVDDYCKSKDYPILKIDGVIINPYSPVWGG